MVVTNCGNRGHEEVGVLHDAPLENNSDLAVSVFPGVVPLDREHVLVGANLLVDTKCYGLYVHQDFRQDLCVLLQSLVKVTKVREVLRLQVPFGLAEFLLLFIPESRSCCKDLPREFEQVNRNTGNYSACDVFDLYVFKQEGVKISS